ncbi:hypothetical protein ABN763_07055 [Spongiivirga sp. MCCC 1A20706]|uniref:hypothetical protein n=1 Tax=Spongiivirga sp. MCCC 1A20706 TaxID=3160963 RepID=UPI00397760F0
MLRPVAPLFVYVVNQDYIAEFLCINKDKPELACKGKCQLMIMYEEQEKENSKNAPRIALEEYPIGFVNFILLKEKPQTVNATNNSFHYINNYRYRYSFQDDHPPNLNS